MSHATAEILAAAIKFLAARAPDQIQAAALADTLISKIEAADVVIITAPMYNFSVPSTLKARIDHVARARRTFHYTSDDPKGLLLSKKVFVASTRDEFYSDGPAKIMDFHETYLRAGLGFTRLQDITFIHTENLARGDDSVKFAQDDALTQIHALGA
jgi:FMN-dependent NADH-azoreductase